MSQLSRAQQPAHQSERAEVSSYTFLNMHITKACTQRYLTSSHLSIWRLTCFHFHRAQSIIWRPFNSLVGYIEDKHRLLFYGDRLIGCDPVACNARRIVAVTLWVELRIVLAWFFWLRTFLQTCLSLCTSLLRALRSKGSQVKEFLRSRLIYNKYLCRTWFHFLHWVRSWFHLPAIPMARVSLIRLWAILVQL